MQTGKVVVMHAAKNPGILSKILGWGLRIGSKALGVIGAVLDPLPAGAGSYKPANLPSQAPKPDNTDNDDDDDNDKASVRFQVQTAKINVSSNRQTNSKKIGVTKKQGYYALKKIYDDAVDGDQTLGENKDFRSAIIRASKKIKAIQGGLSKGVNQTTLQEKFTHKGREYRIDIEVQRGHNFKL